MGLIDLKTATKEEARAEAIEIINHIPSEAMVRSICSFVRAFYQYYDGMGYQIFLSKKNGEKDVSSDELLRRSREAKGK